MVNVTGLLSSVICYSLGDLEPCLGLLFIYVTTVAFVQYHVWALAVMAQMFYTAFSSAKVYVKYLSDLDIFGSP